MHVSVLTVNTDVLISASEHVVPERFKDKSWFLMICYQIWPTGSGPEMEHKNGFGLFFFLPTRKSQLNPSMFNVFKVFCLYLSFFTVSLFLSVLETHP